jgi:hypothetical protein
MDYTKILDWIKLSPRHLLPLAIFTGFLVFAPPDLLDVFGLTDFVERYRMYFGLGFLLSAALLLGSGIAAGYDWRQRRREEAQFKQRLEQALEHLSEPEKEVLRGYIDSGTKTRYFSMKDGVVGGLRTQGILYPPNRLGDMERWAYNIQPWAWDYLNDHPELLSKTPSEDRSA